MTSLPPSGLFWVPRAPLAKKKLTGPKGASPASIGFILPQELLWPVKGLIVPHKGPSGLKKTQRASRIILASKELLELQGISWRKRAHRTSSLKVLSHIKMTYRTYFKRAPRTSWAPPASKWLIGPQGLLGPQRLIAPGKGSSRLKGFASHL